MRAKITAYNLDETNDGYDDFSMNCYWGNDYKNVFYLCGDFGRSTFEDIIETETDSTGQTTRTQNTSIERFNLAVIVTTPLLQFLKSIDKHDVKEITLLDINKTYSIKNIDIDDEGDKLTPNFLVNINFEDEPITKVSSNVFVLDDQKIAQFDNNGDNIPDINGEAEYLAVTGTGFRTYQLYFESDGVTPATSGDVNLFVYAIADDGFEALVGVYTGAFGDAFNDSSKWQSTQQLWNYFSIGSNVGHTNFIIFDKQGFAEDNGYLSDEQEERAVEVRFELTIDNSTPAKTTLKKVYTIWGGFHSSGVQDFATGEYGITTIGKVNYKNSINTIQDLRFNLVTLASDIITNVSLSSSTNYSNTYSISTIVNAEHAYNGIHTTKGGLTGENHRGSINRLNYTFGMDDLVPITHILNVLNFTSGGTPFDFTFDWKYDKQDNFPVIGDINNTATIYLDGAVVTTIPSIVPSAVPVLQTGSQTITLPDTDVHEVQVYAITTGGYDIDLKFQVQIKPLF